MQRILCLDIGTVRIGVAVSDPTCSFAQALCVLPAEGAWLDDLARIAAECCVGEILIGMPRRTDGTEGPEAEHVRAKMQRIAERLPGILLTLHDERFTTKIAERAMIDADVSRAGRRVRIDKVAAALILQSYLDAHSEAPYVAPDAPAPNRRARGRRG